MKTFTIIETYDDADLEFNENTGRYQLTQTWCKANLDNSYRNDSILKNRIALNSRVVYNYISIHGASVNKTVVAFLLHRTKEGRDFLLELLGAQMYADSQNGYNDLLFQPAINFNGNDKDRTQIRLNALCLAAEQIYEGSDTYFGIRLGYQGQFPNSYFVYVRSNLTSNDSD